MKKAKILLFGLILSVLSICSFSNSQFFDSISCGYSADNPCYLDEIDSFTCEGPSVGYRLSIYVYGEGGNISWDCRRGGNYGGTVSCADLNSVRDAVSSCYFDYSQAKYFYYSVSSPYDISDFKMSGLVSSSEMPVSTLTPVITGLTNSINEFIPYMVYIGLGVLGVIVGFFAIKRLLRFVKGSSLSVFSSRRNKK